ncbi:ABC transporter transmembrane domain-containing protein [Lederbergia sp. NSJ-179]|uniref:ABC transporter ATP-binding protein n=1 Tax=Lederbergia sp. NSJ-179 TaxID=2931402 RepID=UPI001FCF9A4D|nr:ABC transporter transmembrane domain-containing protein [Lederbergia sp. NSJ-179]MCJ7842514.1 ABC transporter transmembrane domain-containing protein [Lederbergia sp. NSJ-179]
MACFKGVITGDAVGKQTETLAHEDIKTWYPNGSSNFHGEIGEVMPRYKNRHYGYCFGETTDDSEQTIVIARVIANDEKITHTSVGRELMTCKKSNRLTYETVIYVRIRGAWERIVIHIKGGDLPWNKHLSSGYFNIKPYSKWLIFVMIGVLIVGVVNIANAHLIKIMTDMALSGDWSKTFYTAFLILPVILVGAISEYVSKYSTNVFSGGIMKDLNQDVIHRMLHLQVSILENSHSGDIISRMTNDIRFIQDFFKNTFHNMILQPVLFLGAFLYLVTINWLLAICTVILMPIITKIVSKISNIIERFSTAVQTREGRANTMVRETITGISMIKSFNLHQTYYKKYENEVNEMLEQKRQIAKRTFFIHAITSFLVMTPYLMIALFGGYLAMNTNMSAGDLVAFIFLMQYLSGPISQILHLFSQFRISISGFRRIYELFDYPLERQTGKPLDPALLNEEMATPIIQFKNVHFSYNKQISVLSNLSFTIHHNETVALVGLSGSGKSTIVDVLTLFYPIQNGSVYVYGRPIDDWIPNELRQQFAVVSQDVHLFPSSIADNIRCGDPQASWDEIQNAGKMSFAHDFIMELPEGYQTIVGENGVTLSGGQRQRIAIARALLKKAPILLLDEATSALDTETERKIQQSLNRLRRGRTTFIIAHRISTVKSADRILVLEGGKIIADGTHETLLQQNDMYRHLFAQ